MDKPTNATPETDILQLAAAKDEEWRPVHGFPGYEVSNMGKVRSYLRGAVNKMRPIPHLLTPHKRSHGIPYLKVSLTHNRRCYSLAVHRLVLQGFVGPCPPGMVACHNDGVPTNNRLDNLRWDTPRSNVIDDARRHGVCSAGLQGEACQFHKLSTTQVLAIRRKRSGGVHIKVLARRYGVTERTISSITRRETWRHI
jgi:hypothetical protein